MLNWLQNPFLIGMISENDTFMRAMLANPEMISDLSNTAFIAPMINELYGSPDLQQLMLQVIPVNSTIARAGIALDSGLLLGSEQKTQIRK